MREIAYSSSQRGREKSIVQHILHGTCVYVLLEEKHKVNSRGST